MFISFAIRGTRAVNMRVRMPPEHQLLDDEKHPEPRDQRESYGMRPGGTRTRDRFRQQRQQRRSEQRPGCEADEVRQDEDAVLIPYPEEDHRECGARDTAERGEQHYR